ncbi:2,3-dihydro-2,3-dihydroxybenzoate dehydrogenase [Aeromonas salmonicida]|uniref:2,3-dihydro-2,3-dihydroxybenzoate dehydrogenase n=1 Tax=Aeromonas salmonicida TaxID=645 RepID=UPI00073129E4|nr:2,3-dihydro-2,3-dihydroxybenzoate dehydrogenase [Aeromonas salmonicida]KTA77855.1 2,3-dihydroxybenzoate-2,3-dehydrogenase [Aeromonas salmonicida]RSM29071.1 2,3-dihydro-2,3-dihydroxybenzoate dehydrogenase [Aeromonas salmonicida]
MAFDFSGKRVWVTGAGRGIGREVAMQFVAAGASVVGLDLAFPEAGYPYATWLLDIGDAAAVNACCAALLADGGLDVLVNGAGVLRLGPTENLSDQDWHDCMTVNATGVFYLLRALVPHFKAQRCGAIVTIGSNAAHVPRMQMAAYCASKAAVTSLTQTVGLELAPFGVRVNLVSPGSTDTPMLRGMLPDEGAMASTIAGLPDQFKLGIPLRKIATPAEIANTVLFLASDLASHITLQDLVVDGGATLSA